MGRGDVPIILCAGKLTSASSALDGYRDQQRIATYRIVFLGEVRGQEEGYFGDFATERVPHKKQQRNGITVHKTVPGRDGCSAGSLHRAANNDQFLRGAKWVRWRFSGTLQRGPEFWDSPACH